MLVIVTEETVMFVYTRHKGISICRFSGIDNIMSGLILFEVDC